MKKIKPVNAIEVKRTYLISDLVRRSDTGKDFLGPITIGQFKNKLIKVKKEVLSLPENVLNTMIAKTFTKRLVAFDTCDWYMGTFKPSEVGVWRRAGKLPLRWSNGSLKETAKYVKDALATKSIKFKKNIRARSVISNILKINVGLIQNEKYLLPIVFKGGSGTNGRKRLKKKMKGDIDDGCMRSIALTINGAKDIKAYLGFPIKTNYRDK